jgi:hypothetical protein
MTSGRLTVLFSLCCALTACAPEILGGDQNTISIIAGPLGGASAVAARHCQKYGKRAVAVGSRQVGPSTPNRIYIYDCINLPEPHR